MRFRPPGMATAVPLAGLGAAGLLGLAAAGLLVRARARRRAGRERP
jgi:hypothetical protein